ncbi:glycosyltransferase family 39 protein, partial [bacterium]|nr:glycosyltransferase family 39 protein [bacterium]
MSRESERKTFLALLAAILVIAGALRLARCERDVPRDIEYTNAPSEDAFWYLEEAFTRADGSGFEPLEPYDRPVWTALARAWFAVFGASFESAHALAATLGTLEVIFLALALRPLGARAALLSALLLATAYPFVALSRTPIIYGPIATFLAGAWALHATGGRTGKILAWGFLGILVFFWKGVAAVLVPALAASHVVLAGREKRRTVLVGGAVLGVLVLALLVVHPTELVSRNRERIERYLGADVRANLGSAWLPVIVVKRALLVPWESGLLALAPALVPLAGTGALLGLRARASLTRDERSILAGAVVWASALLLVLSWLDYRPLRYFALGGPPLAALAGFALSRLLWPAPVQGKKALPGARVLVAGLAASFVLAGALGLAAGSAALHAHDRRMSPESSWLVFAFALAGGAWLALRALRWPSPGRPALARALAGLVLMLAPALDLGRDVRGFREDDSNLRANRVAARALGPGAVLAGPYASLLAAGHPGLERRRGGPELRGGEMAPFGIALA